jgi:nicotinate dehydrogenase subunit A
MKLQVNNKYYLLDGVELSTPLLYVLRNDLALNGAKFGCGLGECGACTVLVDGKPARACQLPVSTLEGRAITTLEGLAPDETHLHPVQQAFIDEQAAQCGYCTNGMIMTLVGLFREKPNATRAEIKSALAFNLCRCGTHMEILQAAERAKAIIAQEGGAL